MPERSMPQHTHRGTTVFPTIAFFAVLLIAGGVLVYFFLLPSAAPLARADYAQQTRESALRAAGIRIEDAQAAEEALAEFHRIYEAELADLYSPDGVIREQWIVHAEISGLESDPQARERFDEAVRATKASGVTAAMDRIVLAGGLAPRLDRNDAGSAQFRRLALVDRILLRDAIIRNDAVSATAVFSRAQGLANVFGKTGYSRVAALVAGSTRAVPEDIILDGVVTGHVNAQMSRALLDATIPYEFASIDQVLEGERSMLRMEILEESRNTGLDDQSLAEIEAKALEAWNAPLGERLEAFRALGEWQSNGWKHSELLSDRAPSYQGLLQTATYADHIHPGFHTALAIETFRLEQGRLPGSLDDLTPDYLSETPVDPMIGDPWVYRLDESSPHGYTLYAVGLDAEDNGGHQPMNAEAALSTANGQGTDYVVIPRRPR